MNSLVSYGSDDDCDDSSDEKPMDSYSSSRSNRKQGLSKQADVNYDEVQMSLSEDSSDESKPTREPPRKQSRDRDDSHREEPRRWNDEAQKSKDDYRSRKDRSDRKDDRNLGRNDREEDRSRNRESINREEERGRDKYRGDKDEDRRVERRGKSRERYSSSRDDRYRDSRDRKERDRRRSRSPKDRDRRRSRSPRKSDKSRSRSRSKDRSSRGGYSKRYDRASSKMERLDKMGIELKSGDCHSLTPSDLQKAMGDDKNDAKDRFFMPGITGRFKEQIEKRKLLWQKKEPEKQITGPVAAPSGLGGSRTTKVWEATTFAQDTDGKVANKFKRLMGIRSVGEGSNTAVDVLKKQEEMFSSMEQQYEVARTATHTMRGVGLGFGSYQR